MMKRIIGPSITNMPPAITPKHLAWHQLRLLTADTRETA